MGISISKHGYMRLKERNGWSKKAADRMIFKVYTEGLRPEDVKGYLKGWINRKCEYDKENKEFVLFGEKLYIFDERMMITVLPVPSRAYLINNAC